MDKNIQRIGCRISDIGKKFNPILDIMSDSSVLFITTKEVHADMGVGSMSLARVLDGVPTYA